MANIDFVTSLHQSTTRDYLERVVQHDKAACAEVAKKFGKDYWDGDRKYGFGGGLCAHRALFLLVLGLIRLGILPDWPVSGRVLICGGVQGARCNAQRVKKNCFLLISLRS